MKLRTIVCTGAATLMGLLAACNEDNGAPNNTSGTIAALDGARVAGVLAATNELELAAAAVAQSRARNELVRDYAEYLLAAHGRAERLRARVVQRTNIAPAESAATAQLRADGEAAMERLARANDEDFDRLFVEEQVRMHVKVMQLIEKSSLCDKTGTDNGAPIGLTEGQGNATGGIGGSEALTCDRGIAGVEVGMETFESCVVGSSVMLSTDQIFIGEAGPIEGSGNVTGGIDNTAPLDPARLELRAFFTAQRSALATQLAEAIWLRGSVVTGGTPGTPQ